MGMHGMMGYIALTALHGFGGWRNGCDQHATRQAAESDEARRLLALEPWAPPPALRNGIALVWTTWSNARDPRGFRARDDRHRREASLQELCVDQEHEIWRVLMRGAVQEVHELKVMPLNSGDEIVVQ